LTCRPRRGADRLPCGCGHFSGSVGCWKWPGHRLRINPTKKFQCQRYVGAAVPNRLVPLETKQINRPNSLQRCKLKKARRLEWTARNDSRAHSFYAHAHGNERSGESVLGNAPLTASAGRYLSPTNHVARRIWNLLGYGGIWRSRRRFSGAGYLSPDEVGWTYPSMADETPLAGLIAPRLVTSRAGRHGHSQCGFRSQRSLQTTLCFEQGVRTLPHFDRRPLLRLETPHRLPAAGLP